MSALQKYHLQIVISWNMTGRGWSLERRPTMEEINLSQVLSQKVVIEEEKKSMSRETDFSVESNFLTTRSSHIRAYFKK